MESKMIYIAAPYYDPNKEVIERRMEIVYEVIAEFTRLGNIVVSPMLMHPVVVRHDLPNTFQFWDKYSFALLEKCDRMVVIQMKGWETSRGVQEEIEFCNQFNIPVEYVSQVLE